MSELRSAKNRSLLLRNRSLLFWGSNGGRQRNSTYSTSYDLQIVDATARAATRSGSSATWLTGNTSLAQITRDRSDVFENVADDELIICVGLEVHALGRQGSLHTGRPRSRGHSGRSSAQTLSPSDRCPKCDRPGSLGWRVLIRIRKAPSLLEAQTACGLGRHLVSPAQDTVVLQALLFVDSAEEFCEVVGSPTLSAIGPAKRLKLRIYLQNKVFRKVPVVHRSGHRETRRDRSLEESAFEGLLV